MKALAWDAIPAPGAAHPDFDGIRIAKNVPVVELFDPAYLPTDDLERVPRLLLTKTQIVAPVPYTGEHEQMLTWVAWVADDGRWIGDDKVRRVYRDHMAAWMGDARADDTADAWSA